MVLRCFLVDDNEHFLRAARDLLEREGISVVGVATTAAVAWRRCRELQPDVTLVDVGLGKENGIELARQLAGTRAAASHIILISARSGDDLTDAIASGPVLPFLPKSDLSGAAIRRILSGGAGGAGG